jgi:hypothetical protein
MDDLTIYCLPISGGRFISQLGLLCELYDAKKINLGGNLNGSKYYQPNLVFASSGGNIATYIGLASDWNPISIERVLKDLKSEMFIKSWLPKELNFIPSWLIGTFKGNLYKQGDGSYEFFNYLFNEETISRVEIWTGTYDKNNNKAQFFCNLEEKNSLIKENSFKYNEFIFNSLPLKYADCNIKKISDITIASASIPVYVSKKNIDTGSYSDGGIMYASPINAMSLEICKLVTGEEYKNIVEDIEIPKTFFEEKIRTYNKKLRLIYFSSYDMENYKINNKNSEDDFENFKGTLKQIIHSSCLEDRNSAINILYKICDFKNIKYCHKNELNTILLAETLKKLDCFLHYVIVLYPIKKHAISISGFNAEEIVEKLKLSRENYGAHIWYFSKTTL